MVGVLGLEPRSLAAQDFESSVFTNFTILPFQHDFLPQALYHCLRVFGNCYLSKNHKYELNRRCPHRASLRSGEEIVPKAAQSKGMNPQSEVVMAFIQDLSLPDGPSEVVRHARYLMLDS